MIRWGIAGPGEIATRFAEGMREIDGGAVVAVGSRSPGAGAGVRGAVRHRAIARAATRRSPRTPTWTRCTSPRRIRAMPPTRAVPLRRQARALREAVRAERDAGERDDRGCREQQRFLMEAMWSRFLPAYRSLRDLLDDARIGEPLLVEASFGWRAEVVPTHRHFDLAQGGGALLDLGVYTVTSASSCSDRSESVVARWPRRHHGSRRAHRRGTPARRRSARRGAGGDPHAAHVHRAHRGHRRRDRRSPRSCTVLTISSCARRPAKSASTHRGRVRGCASRSRRCTGASRPDCWRAR